MQRGQNGSLDGGLILVNLYVDSPNTPKKYNESKLENLLLEWLFKDKDRVSINSKVKHRLFKQERIWSENKLEFPHGNWLRDTLKKIIANIASKKFKEHAEDNFGTKGTRPENKWPSLEMKEFPDDFEISNVNDSGKIDELVGKTSLETRKILDRRYELSPQDERDILDIITDDTSITVNFQQKSLGGKKGTSSNISQAVISYPDIEINKEHIFEKNNIDFETVEIQATPNKEREELQLQVAMPDWPIIVNFNSDEAAAKTKAIEVFWTEENLMRVLKDIFNPYVNYELSLKMVVDIPTFGASTLTPKGNHYYPKAIIFIEYAPISEIRRLKKSETEGKWNPARELYLGTIKDRYNWLNRKIDNLPQNNEEE